MADRPPACLGGSIRMAKGSVALHDHAFIAPVLACVTHSTSLAGKALYVRNLSRIENATRVFFQGILPCIAESRL